MGREEKKERGGSGRKTSPEKESTAKKKRREEEEKTAYASARGRLSLLSKKRNGDGYERSEYAGTRRGGTATAGSPRSTAAR